MSNFSRISNFSRVFPRSSGALAPLFSLPGVRDVGSMGRCVRQFIDDLVESGQRWWQTTPINPIDDFGSPYAGLSAFAGETLYLDLEEFRDEKLLDDDDLARVWFLDDDSDAVQAGSNAARRGSDAARSGSDAARNASDAAQGGSLAEQLDEAYSKRNRINGGANRKLADSNSVPQTDGELVDPRSETIDYRAAKAARRPCWEKAFERYRRGEGGERYRAAEKRFRAENESWLDDFVLNRAAADEFGTSERTEWPVEIRRRDPKALADFAEKNAVKLDFLRFLQLAFDVQWREVRAYCAARSIRIFGDVPIYVGRASADVWAFPELFQVDDDGRIIREAGVPSDDFNPDGQRWGSPTYRWEKHRETGFDWWRRRMRKTLERFDAVRLDHFIGFYNYYSFVGDGYRPDRDGPAILSHFPEVPQTTVQKKVESNFTDVDAPETATPTPPKYEPGWVPGPQEAFFDAIFAELPPEAFVAEDLGVMNDGVGALRDRYNLPGMRVFVFSFDDVKVDPETGAAPNPLDDWPENSVAYTGTHDAAPVLGWLADVEKFGGGAWETLDFAGVANVLDRYRRPGDVPAVVLGSTQPAQSSQSAVETPTNAAGRARKPPLSSKKSKKSENPKKSKKRETPVPKLGVDKTFFPLPAEVAALRTAILRAVASSASRLVVFPIQDVVGLSNDSRVNFPGIGVGNWTWRLAPGALTPEIKAEWRRLTEETGRI